MKIGFIHVEIFLTHCHDHRVDLDPVDLHIWESCCDFLSRRSRGQPNNGDFLNVAYGNGSWVKKRS